MAELIVETEFRGRPIEVYRILDLYYCWDGGRLVQEHKPAEAVMRWLANIMMNA